MEERVQFKSDDAVLAGTLQTPMGEPPYPACLLLGGSGPQLRDGSPDFTRTDYFPRPLSNRPLLEIEAHVLEKIGVASLRYDKRGCGESSGDIAKTGFSQLARDAEAALDYLKINQSVDPRRVGILGQSEGAVVGLLVSSRTPDLAFYVWQSGFIDGVEKICQFQRNSVNNLPAEALEEFKAVAPFFYWELVFQENIFAAVREGQDTITIGDSDWSLEIGLSYYRDLMGLDLENVIAQIRCPVLIVQGEEDENVPSDNPYRAERALTSAGNRNVTLKVLPGIGHSLDRVGELETVEDPPTEFVPDSDAISMIVSWISECVGLPISGPGE